jgi:hypothetical protein
LRSPVRKTNGTPIRNTIAVHPVTSEIVFENGCAPTLTAKRNSVAPPASRTGANARRDAGLECFQRPTRTRTTASKYATATSWTSDTAKMRIVSLSETRNALLGHPVSAQDNGSGSTGMCAKCATETST